MTDKWVVQAAGTQIWSTMSENWHMTMRLGLRHFGIPDDVLLRDDKIVHNRWLAFIKGRHDRPEIIPASLNRGNGKTIPNPDEGRKVIKWRVTHRGISFEHLKERDAWQAVLSRHAGITMPDWMALDAFKRAAEAVAARHGVTVDPVYEEPKSTYVTRESAEVAIVEAINTGKGKSQLFDLLEDKPRERVKAGGG